MLLVVKRKEKNKNDMMTRESKSFKI